MTRKRNVFLAGVAVLAAAGLGTGVALADGGSPGHPDATATAAGTAASAAPGYSWYRSMMAGYHGGAMTGGSPNGWMMSDAGYAWMTGGAALWFLGEPTAAGMHAGTLAFTADTPGKYQYLCPVPDHAHEGMAGTFTVR